VTIFNRKNAKLSLLIGVLLASVSGHAMTLDWAGLYRFEYVNIDKTSLTSPSLQKAYFLNYLSLMPKIVASDGVNIKAKLNVLSNSYYPNSQVGQAFGLGSDSYTSGVPSSSGTQDSNVAGGNQRSSYLQVSQLYMTINQEYGAIVVGRAPVQFGLGMTYNAGNGPFDHWSDTRDMIGYKFIIGNLYIMPIFDRVYSNGLSQGQSVQDMVWNIEYNNSDTQSVFGLWHQTRTSGNSSNDAPAVGYGGDNATVGGSWNTQDVNIYIARGFDSAKFRLEAGFRSGTTGVMTTTGDEVRVNGYGVALEVDLPNPEGKTSWQIRTGIASGDNPGTSNYEGFHMNRNYDVAFLLMNHPLGSYDLFRTNLQRNRDPQCNPNGKNTAATVCPAGASDQVADEEVVSNVMYFSPRFKYTMSDKMDFTGSFTFAQLQTTPLANDTSVAKDVGYEIDTGITYRATDRVQWVNELGLLFPGGAFKGSTVTNTNSYSAGFTYGFQSKAAISF
jgi:hypothetical protein